MLRKILDTSPPLIRCELKMNEGTRGGRFQPKISVVMPVYNIDQIWLEKAIDSVNLQQYENWELCIVDDASTSPRIKGTLQSYADADERIRVCYLDKNLGIAGASNAALSLASGSYVALLDHDDELTPDSLQEVVSVISKRPDTDLIYTDEDKIDLDGMCSDPVCKPDWSPELFLTYNYLCHLIVCRKEIIDRAGGFRKGFDGSQDYDLLLRVTEITDKIVHIPKVLYHWRKLPGSAASRVDAKRYAFESSKKALREAMNRRGLNAVVSNGKSPGTFKVSIKDPASMGSRLIKKFRSFLNHFQDARSR